MRAKDSATTALVPAARSAIGACSRDERRLVGRPREPGERVAAELSVLLGNGRHEAQVLGGDDLVGVDVVAQHVDAATDRHWRSSRGSVMRPVTAEAATV